MGSLDAPPTPFATLATVVFQLLSMSFYLFGESNPNFRTEIRLQKVLKYSLQQVLNSLCGIRHNNRIRISTAEPSAIQRHTVSASFDINIYLKNKFDKRTIRNIV